MEATTVGDFIIRGRKYLTNKGLYQDCINNNSQCLLMSDTLTIPSVITSHATTIITFTSALFMAALRPPAPTA